jgi:hypothetical protein
VHLLVGTGFSLRQAEKSTGIRESFPHGSLLKARENSVFHIETKIFFQKISSERSEA